MTAIINTPVKNYVALKVGSISDRKLIANTDKLVRASGLMSKILNQNSGSADPKFNKIYLDVLNNKLSAVNKVIVP